MSRNLSQIVADLFANPADGKDLASQIQRLGEEVRKVLHSDDTLFGKFRGLMESFREVIPEEQQRYQAALKALSTTTKLDNKAILKALSGQIEELKTLEKGIMPSLSGWSEGLKTMEARSQQLKVEISALRVRLTQLEAEEKTVHAGMAAREKDLKNAEKTVRDLFANIGAEITAVQTKMQELTGEAPAEQPAAQKEAVKGEAPGKKKGAEKKVEIQMDAAPEDTKFQRKCPMCGGRFNLLELEHMWQCYNCGHEESTAEGGHRAGEPAPAPEPASDPFSSLVEPPASVASEVQQEIQKKPCPGCGKTMFHYPKENAWRCPSCGYERRI